MLKKKVLTADDKDIKKIVKNYILCFLLEYHAAFDSFFYIRLRYREPVKFVKKKIHNL